MIDPCRFCFRLLVDFDLRTMIRALPTVGRRRRDGLHGHVAASQRHGGGTVGVALCHRKFLDEYIRTLVDFRYRVVLSLIFNYFQYKKFIKL